MEEKKTIGVDVSMPKETCNDSHCPFHSGFSVRGRTLFGTVTKNVLHKTASIEFPRLHYVPKYERFEKRRTRIKAHVPPCMIVAKGDHVRIMESRKISKTKSFVVIEVRK
ncbi:MAG TPA: 30S ribosomal protein S17 [Candidatus Nanoarchaeia archaeon]|nr:30S ribosomal protein S17 [Candidatus Nanoarchaeia archaeon]